MQHCTAALLVLLMALPSFAQQTSKPPRDYPVKPVPFTSVHFRDRFWLPKIETNRKVTIPFAFQKCEETGRSDLIERAGEGAARRASRK